MLLLLFFRGCAITTILVVSQVKHKEMRSARKANHKRMRKDQDCWQQDVNRRYSLDSRHWRLDVNASATAAEDAAFLCICPGSPFPSK